MGAKDSRSPDPRPVPLPLIRDLVAVAFLTEERPSARSRLERALGTDFVQQLLSSSRPASARHAA
jgi:hypothetical protein